MLLLGDQAEKLAQALSSSGKLEFLVEILFGPLPPRTKYFLFYFFDKKYEDRCLQIDGPSTFLK
jgi:hypothetical protein